MLRLQTGVDRTKFWQVTVSFTHEKNLSGLGMAMVKHLALREKVSQQSSSSEKRKMGVVHWTLCFEFGPMIGGRLLQNRVISSDHCERKDGTDPSASVSVTVAVRTKDRFRFVTPEEVNDTGPAGPRQLCIFVLFDGGMFFR